MCRRKNLGLRYLLNANHATSRREADFSGFLWLEFDLSAKNETFKVIFNHYACNINPIISYLQSS